MATHIEIGTAMPGLSGSPAPIEDALLESATITPSGANQRTAFAAHANNSMTVTISADENVFIAIGDVSVDVTTLTALRRSMIAGGVRSFRYTSGQQVAVVTR